MTLVESAFGAFRSLAVQVYIYIYIPESAKTLAASRCVSLKLSAGVGGGVWGGGVGVSSPRPPPGLLASGAYFFDPSWLSQAI